MKYASFVLLSTLSCVLDVSLAFLDDDPCRLFDVSDLSKETQVIDMPIPNGCMKGEIEWHYPKGDLLLHVKMPSSGYHLCIYESWATYIGEIKDVTGGGNRALTLPAKDDQAPALPSDSSCTKAKDSHLQLLISAADTQYYMTALRYTVISSSGN